MAVMGGEEGYEIEQAIEGEEDYAGNKLGSIIEQPCSHFSMRIRAKFSIVLRCIFHSGLIHENFDTLTSCSLCCPVLFYRI